MPRVPSSPPPPPQTPSGMSASSELAAIYAEIPAIACKRKCANSCGLVAQYNLMSPAEARRLSWYERIPDPADPLRCELLEHGVGLCRVYAMRPVICRLWGVVDVDGMRCPFGCTPERWLTDEESRDILRRVDAIQ